MKIIKLILKRALVIIFCALTQVSMMPMETKYSAIQPRIVGGNRAEITDYPFQMSVRVKVKSHYIHICGGSLIKTDVVLTAAHCVIESQSYRYRVFAGSNSLIRFKTYSDADWIKAHEFFRELPGVHPKNVSTVADDIAVIKLAKSFKMTKFISVIPTRDTLIFGGEQCTISGWGRTSAESPISAYLMAAEVPIYNWLECNNVYQRASGRPIQSTVVCAGYPEGGKDSCKGDSGGPLVCGGLLVGIVSYGVPCAKPGIPTVYTEVAQYKDWITLNSAKRFQPSCILLCLIQILYLYFIKIFY